MSESRLEEARQAIEAVAIEAEHKCLECGSTQVGSSYDPAPIQAALDAAERRGFERYRQKVMIAFAHEHVDDFAGVVLNFQYKEEE